MFGIGMPEMLMILVVALVVVGPKRLPEMAQTIGRAMGKLRSITSDFQREMDKEMKPVREINPFADGENSIQPPQENLPQDHTEPPSGTPNEAPNNLGSDATTGTDTPDTSTRSLDK